jgi:hypothetical protein
MPEFRVHLCRKSGFHSSEILDAPIWTVPGIEAGSPIPQITDRKAGRPWPGACLNLKLAADESRCCVARSSEESQSHSIQGGQHRSRVDSIIHNPARGHHQGGGWPNIEVHICRGGLIKRYLSDVRRRTSEPQKSEPQKSMMERTEFREGLRGRIIISVLLHFSEHFGNTKGNQRLS